MRSRQPSARTTRPDLRPDTSRAGRNWSRKPRLRIVLALFALVALVAIAYWNSLDNSFVWDDHQQIVLNPYLKPNAPLLPLFTHDLRFAHESDSTQTHVYRPLQLLTYRAIVAVFGPDARAFHAVNLLFAIACTISAFFVLRRLTQSTALAFSAAALFAVYPIHTEAVDWIAALPDLGCTLFLLLAFYLFLTRIPALALLCFALALLWKETAVVLPLLLIAYIALTQPAPRRLLHQTAPYWAILAAYLALRSWALASTSPGERTWQLSPILYVINILHLFAAYWVKLVLPIGLNAYYTFHPIRSLAGSGAAIALVFAVAAAAAIYLLVRRAPLPAFAILFVSITLLPALNLYGLGRNAFAERYLYLPSFGFCLLIVLAAVSLLKPLPLRYRQPTAGALLLIALTAFTTLTIARNPIWHDDATLFADALAHSPDAPFVLTMAAIAQSSSDPTAAEPNFLAAISLAARQTPPDRVDALAAYQALAALYADQQRLDKAFATLAQARQLAPNDPNTAAQQGILLARAGRGDEAEPLLTQSLAAQPGNENVLSALGLIARDAHHDPTRAIDYFIRALAAHPEPDDFNAAQHNNLGAIYGDQGDFTAALAEFRQAAAITPTEPEYRINLAQALAATGNIPEATEQAQQALRLAPNEAAARDLLAHLTQQK